MFVFSVNYQLKKYIKCIKKLYFTTFMGVLQMDNDKKIKQDNDNFKIKVFKSALYTFYIAFFSLLLGSLLSYVTQPSGTLYIISTCIGLIFTVLYCTFTIIEEIRNQKQ